MMKLITMIASLTFFLLAQHGYAQEKSSVRTQPEEAAQRSTAKGVVPFSGTFTVVKRDGGVNPQPLVTTCGAGAGESCALFASNCLAAGGHYNGDNAGGICCSGVDHPRTNPGSACN